MSGLETLPIRRLAALVADRALSAVEVTEHFLARMAALDGALAGFNLPTPEAARTAAAALDARLAAGEAAGPLAGIPLSVKDVADVAGLVSAGASASRAGRRAQQDAPAVARLRAADAILLGKANCHELAFGGPSFDLPFPP
ncbi:MAG TPA: amidase family protein, partial [Shinella sp.]|nr:amidase family protein [Shinella sp.]